MEQFFTPPDHVGFTAKKLDGGDGKFLDVSIAFLEKGGGGPVHAHTHVHNHLFIVVQGKARVDFENESVFIQENESFLVQGVRKHSVWNALEGETVMIGINLKKEEI